MRFFIFSGEMAHPTFFEGSPFFLSSLCTAKFPSFLMAILASIHVVLVKKVQEGVLYDFGISERRKSFSSSFFYSKVLY